MNISRLLEDYANNPEALDLIRLIAFSRDSVFLTGKAGTGKSTLLERLKAVIHKNYIVLAPTGIAALHVGGQTLHSFFQFEPRPYLPYDKGVSILRKKEQLLKKLELIIIDEVSMVRADLMSAIDTSLRKNCKDNRPFAGKQLLLIGDLFQLPPVIDRRKKEEAEILNSHYESPYFFSAPAMMQGLNYHTVELQKVYRQKDKGFISLLNGVRENQLHAHHLQTLNTRYRPDYMPAARDYEIILTTTNDLVRRTNQARLQQLGGKLYTFPAQSSGVFAKEGRESKLPAPKNLSLKEGSQVMFIKNDPDRRWVNGSLGKVISLQKGKLHISVDLTRASYFVEPVTWENYEYKWNKEEERVDKHITGTFTQYPLKLAWAVTIHKSQGQTFDKVSINLGRGAFTTGQTYVALSRCRSMEGITLKTRIRPSDIQVDQRIKTFINSKTTEEMDRKKYEAIVKGMRQASNQNLELIAELQISRRNEGKHKTEKKQLQANLSAKEQVLQRKQEEVETKKKELAKVKSNNFLLSLLVLGLIVLMIFLQTG